MSKKRVLSALTSAVCAAGIVTAFPEQFDKTYAVFAELIQPEVSSAVRKSQKLGFIYPRA